MYSNVLILGKKMKKKHEKNAQNNTKRVMHYIRPKDELLPKYSVLGILQNDLPSQKHFRRQSIPTLEYIKCTFDSCFR